MGDTTLLVSRRQFCAGACQAASGATLATLLSGCGGPPTSPGDATVSTLGVLSGRFAGSGVQVAVAGSPLADVDGTALVESTAGVFLVARTSATTFAAVDGVCTHEGCTITGAAGTTYVCPCHGSQYTRGGQVVQGPASSSLRQHATTFADGVLTIAL
jgi:cytochrome b6-f complex iron-sulfur subunit